MKASRTTLPVWSWLYFAMSFFLGIVAGICGDWMIVGNAAATDVIVTVFSILAGFLIAMMTFLGDQSMLPGSWKRSTQQSRRIKAKLTRQKWLFALYLTTLGLIFIAALLRRHYPDAVTYLERAYFGLATMTFLLSLKLPWTLMAIQQERLDAVAEARKGKTSILERN